MKQLYSNLLIIAIIFFTHQIYGQISVDGNGLLEIRDPDGTSNFLRLAQGSNLYDLDINSGDLVFRPNGLSTGHSVIMTDDTDSPVHFWGKVNLGTYAPGIILEANGAQALWFDDDFYSWGYGKDWNYFADEILIGGETGPAFTPNNTDGLSIAESKDIRLDGSGSRSLRFTNGATLDGTLGYSANALFFNNVQSAGYNSYRTTNGEHRFYTSSPGAPKMVITSDGNVGIGTSTPLISDGLTLANSLDIRLDGTGTRTLRFTDDTDTDALLIATSSGGFFVQNNNATANSYYVVQVGDHYFRTNGSEDRMIIKESGNVGIGTITPAFTLQVAGDVDVTGELTAASDLRLKKNIEPIKGALSTIRELNPVSYDFRVDEFPDLALSDRHRMGLVAQEVESVLPQNVSYGSSIIDSDGSEMQVMSVNYMEMIPLLIKSVQELEGEMNSLKTELKQKNAQIRQLNEEFIQLKNLVKSR